MPNILIIDQDPHIRQLVRQALERVGYTVAQASTFTEVSEQIDARLPDIIILDCLLGACGLGLELLRDLRDTPRTRDIPLIISTGIPALDIHDPLRNYGAAAYLLKPFGLRELVEAVALAGQTQAPLAAREHAAAC